MNVVIKAAGESCTSDHGACRTLLAAMLRHLSKTRAARQ